MKTKNALIMFCEKCHQIMELQSFDYDTEYAWYHFCCLNCGRQRLCSITLNTELFPNELKYDGVVY